MFNGSEPQPVLMENELALLRDEDGQVNVSCETEGNLLGIETRMGIVNIVTVVLF